MDDDEILHQSIFIDEGFNLRRSEGEKSQIFWMSNVCRAEEIHRHLGQSRFPLICSGPEQVPSASTLTPILPTILLRAVDYGGILRTLIKWKRNVEDKNAIALMLFIFHDIIIWVKNTIKMLSLCILKHVCLNGDNIQIKIKSICVCIFQLWHASKETILKCKWVGGRNSTHG